MFNFFIQNRNKEMQSLAEIIAVDMAKLNLSRLAISSNGFQGRKDKL